MAKKRDTEYLDDSVAGEEFAGVGTGREAQTTAEAVEAEKRRREDMSEVEKEEAETRDRLAEALAPDDRKGEIPNLGSPDEEGRENSNDEIGPNEKFGTGPDERTRP